MFRGQDKWSEGIIISPASYSIFHVMELTGLKPVSLLGLSHIPRGQRCLQKLTMEKLPPRLVLTLTSAITCLSTWSTWRTEGEATHTQGSLVKQMKVHSPRSALPLDLSTSGTTGSQEITSISARQLQYCQCCNWADSGLRTGTEVFWAMTDEMQKLKVLLPSLIIISQSLCSALLLEVAKPTWCVLQPRAPPPQTVPVNPILCNYSRWWRCSSQDTESN